MSAAAPRPARRTLAGLAVLAALALGGAACGGDDDSARAGATTDAAHPAGHPEGHPEGHPTAAPAAFEGGIVSPRRAAPPLALADHTGAPFDLRALRGAPVLVTFVYASCPDVCPAIMRRVAEVRTLVARRGGDLRVVAVSVDPEGDTPAVVAETLGRHRVEGFVRYLIGERPALEAVWRDWGVGTSVPTDDPALIEHTALIYGVSAGGELVTAYPLDIEPAAIVRDLELLAGV